MKKRIYIGKYLLLAIVILLSTAAGLFWYFSQEKRDEAQIRNLLHSLTENLSKSPDESAAAALLKVKTITGALADPMLFAMDHYAQGSYDRERILSSVTRYRTMIKTAKVSADDIVITVNSDSTATGFFSGKFVGELKNGMSDKIIKDIDAEFVKIDGKWKIKSLKFTNILH